LKVYLSQFKRNKSNAKQRNLTPKLAYVPGTAAQTAYQSVQEEVTQEKEGEDSVNQTKTLI
jgi:hypothetical protein